MKKDVFLSLLSSLLLILSFPNYNLWILAWFVFMPLFFALENKSKGKAFLLAYFTGIFFWAGTIYWLIHVTLLGTILLVLYLALYFALFGLCISSLVPRPSSLGLFLIASLWVILEYIRSHLFTGFPWALLGYSQYLNLPVIQIADITGAWGVSFVVMMLNVFIYSVVSRKSYVISAKQKYLLPIICLSVTLIYGYFKIYHLPLTTYNIPFKVSVIQPNIPQELKWSASASSYILDKFIGLTKQAAKAHPDLILWPEAASPEVLGEGGLTFEKIFSLAKETNTHLLIGSVVNDNEKYFNSALLINKQGKLICRYDKLHLVPFGEYIPLKRLLPFLQTVVPIGDITPGREYTIFKMLPQMRDPAPSQTIGGTNPRFPFLGNFAVLICFEDLFPELSQQFVKNGAQFLVNITNDAWYKKTSAASQHLQASVFRAVENRVHMVRSANTGISGFIAPKGKIVSLLQDKVGRNIFIDGYLTEYVDTITYRDKSFYTRYGDIFVIICLLFSLYGIIRVLS